MFGIMFEVSLFVASLKISKFMNKPLFIHTSEKPNSCVKSKTCSCERAKIKPPYI